MLAVATSLFKGTSLAQSYNFSTPASSSTNLSTFPAQAHFNVGPWKVQAATHRVTSKQVSVWTFEKRSLDRAGGGGRERVFEILKAEASSLGRLRHPCILEMVEPMEETRSEITFATEPLMSSLALSIPGSKRSAGGGTDSTGELDEVEIQKGVLQVCRGLEFLHTSAKLVHANLSPEAILINTKGDWKLAGLGMTMALMAPDGTKARWEFPEYDARLPPYTQRKFDYMAPEYALDEQIVISSDMYALGCVLHAAHNYGKPPFLNHGSMNTLRENAARLARGEIVTSATFGADFRDLLNRLITRTPANRLTTTTLPTQPFFSSLAISTLNFLDRSTFSSKPKEEKATFMKGLLRVLPRFSEGLKRRKILPSLVEEMKDPWLLPFILPNVFEISSTLSKEQFAQIVLPSIKPLFQIRDPPQNMITLLENLKLFQEKTTPAVFKEHVLPLIYNALESEHIPVQERALKAVPDVSETTDYSEVQSVLFPRVAVLFTRTRVLSVKVNTLVCFLNLVTILDQTSLTQKLVPLLAKIRTKEPSVMMATLDVHEAMGQKVDREAVATLVLPQLWAMSMGPLLSIAQFSRFMKVIRGLGDRVEREHSQHLRETQRIEQQTPSFGSSDGTVNGNGSGELDFEDLVAGGKPRANGTPGPTTDGWDEADPWGSIFAEAGVAQPTPVPSFSFPQMTPISPPSNGPTLPLQASPPARYTPASPPMSSNRPSVPTALRPPPGPSRPSAHAPRAASPLAAGWSQQPLSPTSTSLGRAPTNSGFQPPKPNYSISLDPTPPTHTTMSGFSSPSQPPWPPTAPPNTSSPSPPSFNSPPLSFTSPPGQSINSILMPTKVGTLGTSSGLRNSGWEDFDPLG